VLSFVNPTFDLVLISQMVRGAQPLFRMQMSTMAIKDNLLVAGGFRGELICKVSRLPRCAHLSVIVCMLAHGFVSEQYVDQPGVAFCTNLAEDKDSITNAVDVYESPK